MISGSHGNMCYGDRADTLNAKVESMERNEEKLINELFEWDKIQVSYITAVWDIRCNPTEAGQSARDLQPWGERC